MISNKRSRANIAGTIVQGKKVKEKYRDRRKEEKSQKRKTDKLGEDGKDRDLKTQTERTMIELKDLIRNLETEKQGKEKKERLRQKDRN